MYIQYLILNIYFILFLFLMKFLPQSLYHECIVKMLAVLARRATNKKSNSCQNRQRNRLDSRDDCYTRNA